MRGLWVPASLHKDKELLGERKAEEGGRGRWRERGREREREREREWGSWESPEL